MAFPAYCLSFGLYQCYCQYKLGIFPCITLYYGIAMAVSEDMSEELMEFEVIGVKV